MSYKMFDDPQKRSGYTILVVNITVEITSVQLDWSQLRNCTDNPGTPHVNFNSHISGMVDSPLSCHLHSMHFRSFTTSTSLHRRAVATVATDEWGRGPFPVRACVRGKPSSSRGRNGNAAPIFLVTATSGGYVFVLLVNRGVVPGRIDLVGQPPWRQRGFRWWRPSRSLGIRRAPACADLSLCVVTWWSLLTTITSRRFISRARRCASPTTGTVVAYGSSAPRTS